MNIMGFDEKTGALNINEHPIELSSLGDFLNSYFYNNTELNNIGKYYFSLDSVTWLGESFVVEFRPSVFSFSPSINLVSKESDFYNNLFDWGKRADLMALKNEENRLTTWVDERFFLGKKQYISAPPYGVTWEFEWGNITVQSNRETFECGIYITWPLLPIG